MENGWLDEVDFDPDGAWLRMGTRRLGSRPWLVVDDRRQQELAEKDRLLAERHHEVFAADPMADDAAAETLALVSAEADDRAVPAGLHPLDEAGRLVQEDLCLMAPADGRWILAAASLCFPTRWRLADKMGRPLEVVHGPVVGYDPVLANRVDGLLDALDEQIVWRRNWFVLPNPALFQPERLPQQPVVEADDCLGGLYVRSERQTLRKLPGTGFVLFTIRIQQEPMSSIAANEIWSAAMVRFLEDADADLCGHRGLGPSQRPRLLAALRAGTGA